jgi:hypothetical protein
MATEFKNILHALYLYQNEEFNLGRLKKRFKDICPEDICPDGI